MNAPALEVQRLSIRYPGAAPVIADLDLAVAPGEIVAVLGQSGVGKSSLLRVLGGLQRASSGRVLAGGVEIDAPQPRVAVAFQDPALLPWLTLEGNVAFGLDFKRQPRREAAARKALIDAAIAEVGLEAARKFRPSALSGGMAQRTALARCLAREPDVLLLDEPFGALDEVTRAAMQALLLKVVARHRAAALLITHDVDEALNVADRIVLLGGAPARAVGVWDVDLPHPREDAVAETGALRIEILTALRSAVRRH
ncbi:ABC transporter ATP-binding protein [Chenggangzhangella methanolivorans]|uniref:ABC transporter ATP-binding protein n=1 Tax=Chenggangzhangella methanolivorans TaxID=1437009 RepID=UPI003608BEEB